MRRLRTKTHTSGGRFTYPFSCAAGLSCAARGSDSSRDERDEWRNALTECAAYLDSRGELSSATHEPQRWRERLDEVAPDRFTVVMRIMAGGVRSAASGGFRARIRDGRRQWALLQASPITGGDDDGAVAVSIELVAGEQLVRMLFAAYGLSPREQEVCREVIGGYPTVDMASHLFVTPNTVQDHLKSVFAKTGVRSRGELVARLQPRLD